MVAPLFRITDPHSEKELSKAGFQVTEANVSPVAKWRFVSNFALSTLKYLKNVFEHAPQVNDAIQRMDKMIQKELDSQKLEYSDHMDREAIKLYEKNCLNILHNIQTHENMVKKFSENLFLGSNSPILSSHIKEKEKVLAHLRKIANLKVLLEIRDIVHPIENPLAPDLRSSLLDEKVISGKVKLMVPEEEQVLPGLKIEKTSKVMAPIKQEILTLTIDELKQGVIDEQINELSKIDRGVLKQLCDQTDLRFHESPQFLIYFRLHLILHDSSPTYRELLAKVRAQSEKTCPSLPSCTPLSILPMKEFPFEACWKAHEHAVCINIGENGPPSDTEKGRSQIGSFIAFEITNALQDLSFKETWARALKGEFELSQVMLGVDLFISEMEEIEQHGIMIQMQIIAEAKKGNPKLVNDDWNRWENHKAKQGIGCFMNSHGDYYREHYIQNVRPLIDAKFKNGTLQQKMAYQFQLGRREQLEL